MEPKRTLESRTALQYANLMTETCIEFEKEESFDFLNLITDKIIQIENVNINLERNKGFRKFLIELFAKSIYEDMMKKSQALEELSFDPQIGSKKYRRTFPTKDHELEQELQRQYPQENPTAVYYPIYLRKTDSRNL